MKMYTAHEMRVRSDYLEGALADKKTAAMLRQAADEVKRLRAENAQLKAALKPVLEVGWVEKRYNYCSGTVPTKNLYLVVREAQGIYNGGGK